MTRAMKFLATCPPINFPLDFGFSSAKELSVPFDFLGRIDRVKPGHELFVIVEMKVMWVVMFILSLTFVLSLVVSEFDCLLDHNKWII